MAQSSPTKINPNPLSTLVPVGTYNGVEIFGPDHNIVGALPVKFSNDTTDSVYFIRRWDKCKLQGLIDDNGKIEGMFIPTPPILVVGPGGRRMLFDLKKNRLDELALSIWYPPEGEIEDKNIVTGEQSRQKLQMIWEEIKTILGDLEEFEVKVNERLEKLEASLFNGR